MALSVFKHDLSDQSQHVFCVNFGDDAILTTVTCEPDSVDSWIADIERIHYRRLHRLVVGLDVEWRPNNRQYTNPVATLQLCVGRRCLIFQLIYAPHIPDSLAGFLTNPSYTFTGVGIDEDVEKIRDDYGLGVENVVDLRDIAANSTGDRSLRSAGLKTLADQVLGREMQKPKAISRSRWDRRFLDSNQVMYACLDAFISFEIGRTLDVSVN